MKQKFLALALVCSGLVSCPQREKERFVTSLDPPMDLGDEGASDESPVIPASVPYSSPDSVPVVPRVPRGSTVLLAGDSLGVGMKDRFCELARSEGYRPVTQVMSGTSTFQWVVWIKKHLDKHRPALVLISLGTNDAMQVERAKKSNVYAEMAKVIQDSGAELVWIVPHRIDRRRIPKIDETRDFIRSTVPLCFDSAGIEVPLAPDRVHTSRKGYERWIEEVWKWMKEINMIDSSPR